MDAPAKKMVIKGKKTTMPNGVSPMLCTLTREPVENNGYVYEVKLDGYRIIATADNGKIKLGSRSGLDYTPKYPPVEKAMRALKQNVVLDGEVVVLNDSGMPDFDALQLFNGHEKPICYYVFDIIWINGYDIRKLTLLERKKILQSLLKGNKVIRYSEHFEDGMALYKKVQELGMEGIVAKRKDSTYNPGERGSDWLKTPTMVRQEFVIGGWQESDKARSFKSLLFGAYNKEGKLEWIGRSGGGYKDAEMPGILKQLQAIETEKSPFVNAVLDQKGSKVHYVKPKLVANFSFATWTKSGRIRKPATFLGFRKDKKPSQVVREIPKEIIET